MLQTRSSKVSDSSLLVGSHSALSLSWGLAIVYAARHCGLVRDKEVQHETQRNFDYG